MRKQEKFDLITPCNESIDISKGYSKLELNSTQKMQISSLLQHIPSASIAASMPNLYTVSFPNGGSPADLMRLSQGGFGSAIMGKNGVIAHASFNPLGVQALAMGCFTAMSIASSQYFLKQIGNEIKMVRLGIEKILDFLYGEKRAELISEVSFIKYAYQNYTSLMSHEQQRIAILEGIYHSKKVAMKDIDFYIADLDSVTNKSDNIEKLVSDAIQIKNSLDTALQLYSMSSLMEVYYAQNCDKEYIDFICDDVSTFIRKCGKRMLSDFAVLNREIEKTKNSLFGKVDEVVEKSVIDIMEDLNNEEISELEKVVKASLDSITQKAKYIIEKDGTVYFKPD